MIGSALLMMIATAAVPTGQVTAASGQVRIEREGQPLAARLRAALEPGDRVETAREAGAGLFLYDGQSVYLGPESLLAIPPEGGPAYRVERGEVRSTVDSDKGLNIDVGKARVEVARGTVWTSLAASGARVRVEHGQARVSIDGRPAQVVDAGQEIAISAAGEVRGPAPTDPATWTLPVDAIGLAGAAAESRRAKEGLVVAANDDVADEFLRKKFPGRPQPAETAPEGTNPPTPAADQAADESYQPIAVSQANSSFSGLAGSLALGGSSGGFSFSGSGGLGNDAQQDSRNPLFPGNIFLVTALSRYSLDTVRLKPADNFPSDRSYYSIGVGALPTGAVSTTFGTGTGASAGALRIPQFNAYVFQLSEFNIADPGTSNPLSAGLTGISGLLGPNPLSPQVQGATPLIDSRAAFNNRATFALGEFALQRDPSRPTVPQFEIRRSDQDRLIVPGTGPADPAIPNPQIFPRYANVFDPKFFPEFPGGVKVPENNGFLPPPSIGRIDLLRKAAVTTLLADNLHSYSQRTGQTQFVVDGQIINIAGYSPAAARSAVSARKAPGGPARLPNAASLRGANLAAAKAGPGLRSFGPRPEAGGARGAAGPRVQAADLRRAAARQR